MASSPDSALLERLAETLVADAARLRVRIREARRRGADPDAWQRLAADVERAVADGYQLLAELGAVDEGRALTPIGRELAKLPLDPRIGRIVLAARERGCLPEALVIASALSVPDPRERPLEKAQAADQAHLRFRASRWPPASPPRSPSRRSPTRRRCAGPAAATPRRWIRTRRTRT